MQKQVLLLEAIRNIKILTAHALVTCNT